MGYYEQDTANLAVFSSIKVYRHLCSTPLLLKFFQFFLPWPGDGFGDVSVKLLLLAAIAVGCWAGKELSQDTVATIRSAQVIERAVEAIETEPVYLPNSPVINTISASTIVCFVSVVFDIVCSYLSE